MNNLYKSRIDGRVSMFVGMDLHKNYMQIAVMDKKGKVLRNSRIDNNPKHMTRFFDSIDSNEKPVVVMESSSVWYNIYRHLSEERKLDVVLSNPIKTRAIASAKIKTDKLDAVKLADLLRGGYIAECYIPNRRIMNLRELVRHRAALVRMRTKLKNSLWQTNHTGIILGVRLSEMLYMTCTGTCRVFTLESRHHQTESMLAFLLRIKKLKQCYSIL